MARRGTDVSYGAPWYVSWGAPRDGYETGGAVG